MIACWTGQPAMVARLCREPGILLNSRDDWGNSALMWAAFGNKTQCVEKLRAIAGVDWNAVDKNGFSAVLMAVTLGHVGVLEALLPVSGLDLNILNKAGFSVAHRAVKSSKANSLRILQLLCEDGRVDWNVPDPRVTAPS